MGNGERSDLRDGKGRPRPRTRGEEHTLERAIDRSIDRSIKRRLLGRRVAERRRKMAKRKGASDPSCSRARKKVDRDAREVENAQRLDSLPLEVWGKIFDELEENDLFPLALSCRYFRQKQKELVERARQRGPGSGKPPLALKTNLMRKVWYFEGPTSAEYLRFCRKEKVPKNVARKRARADQIRYLAAFHGHLPLLQELLKHLKALDIQISRAAGESSLSQSLHILCVGF